MCAYTHRHVHAHIPTAQLESGTARNVENQRLRVAFGAVEVLINLLYHSLIGEGVYFPCACPGNDNGHDSSNSNSSSSSSSSESDDSYNNSNNHIGDNNSNYSVNSSCSSGLAPGAAVEGRASAPGALRGSCPPRCTVVRDPLSPPPPYSLALTALPLRGPDPAHPFRRNSDTRPGAAVESRASALGALRGSCPLKCPATSLDPLSPLPPEEPMVATAASTHSCNNNTYHNNDNYNDNSNDSNNRNDGDDGADS